MAGGPAFETHGGWVGGGGGINSVGRGTCEGLIVGALCLPVKSGARGFIPARVFRFERKKTFLLRPLIIDYHIESLPAREIVVSA